LQKADFLAQNAPKLFVAGLRPDPLESLQRSPDPLAAFDGPTSKRGEGRDEEERGQDGWKRDGGNGRGILRTSYQKFQVTPLLSCRKIPSTTEDTAHKFNILRNL